MAQWLVGGVIVLVGIMVFLDATFGAAFVAVLLGMIIFKSGFALMGSMSMPVPEPPPPGELRKVKIEFRCSLCGTEVRMTAATDELPVAPKHCLEEMDLVAPIE